MPAGNVATQTIVSRTLVSPSTPPDLLATTRPYPFRLKMVAIARGQIETPSSDHIFAPYNFPDSDCSRGMRGTALPETATMRAFCSCMVPAPSP
jgi:hypothetical protein